MAEAPLILLAVDDGVALVTINRPARKNAFNAELHDAFRAALDELDADVSVRALILTGAGDAFCAGQDLGERAASFAAGDPVDLGASLDGNYNPLVRRLARLPIPVIAAVNGVAAGAGAALAIGCDIVLAARSARFQFSFAKVALGPDSGTSWLLPRLVGTGRALALALTATPIAAGEAADIGLVWRVVDDENLISEARRIATEFVLGPAAALTAIKRQMRAAAFQSFDQALDAERDAQGGLGRHPDYREAVMAFAAKRAPRFQTEDRT